MTTDVPLTLLMKLGSIAVHADELLSADGHDFDRVAIRSLLSDPEVEAFVADMTAKALLPVKRSAPPVPPQRKAR